MIRGDDSGQGVGRSAKIGSYQQKSGWRNWKGKCSLVSQKTSLTRGNCIILLHRQLTFSNGQARVCLMQLLLSVPDVLCVSLDPTYEEKISLLSTSGANKLDEGLPLTI